MSSQALNVARWTALAAGILYGFLHQRKIYRAGEKHKQSVEYAHKQSLIDQAKKEWARKHSKSISGSADIDVITDPMNKNFDLEKFLNKLDQQEAKH